MYHHSDVLQFKVPEKIGRSDNANPNTQQIIKRILEESHIFQDTGFETVKACLKKIEAFKGAHTIIRDGEFVSEENRKFYILLRGKLGVYKDWHFLARIEWLRTFWENGFLSGKREAFVIAETDCFVAEVTKTMIRSLSPEIQIKIYENLANELARKLTKANERKINGKSHPEQIVI